MTMSTGVTVDDVRSEAERLRDLGIEAQAALERCQKQARRLEMIASEPDWPRLGSAVVSEAAGLREYVSGDACGEVDMETFLRELENLLALMDVAVYERLIEGSENR